MTTSADTIQPSRLRHAVVKHPITAFLTMMFAVNIPIVWSPAMTRDDVLPVVRMPLSGIVGPILGVALPAFLVVAAIGGRAGVRELASRCLRWRVPVSGRCASAQHGHERACPLGRLSRDQASSAAAICSSAPAARYRSASRR